MIRAMVARLAERLKVQPEDPAGWERLVRSYHVLGDADAEAAALAEVRTRYKDRPAIRTRIEAAAR